MSWADRDRVDEITQCDRGIAYLLRASPSPKTQALVTFVRGAGGPNQGKFFFHEDRSDQLPGRITAEDTPALIRAPTTLNVEAWRVPQSKLVHATALVGLICGRDSGPVNQFVMLTLRALFQRQGRIPDVLVPPDSDVAHDPETTHLDFVQGVHLVGGIDRRPGIPLSKDQSGDLDDDSQQGYKTWGFRMVVATELKADLL